MEPDARANELYWSSDKSVNQIADEMELSKGMLYGMIRPLPTQRPCPRCAATMEYANRTARERGLITCPACALELDENDERTPEQDPAAVALDVLPPFARPAPAKRSRGAAFRHDPRMVGAGLLLIAAGLWLFRGLNRR